MATVELFEIGTIRRLPLGTDYNHVVAIVHQLLRRCPEDTDLVIDGTGIGKPVADMFKFQGIPVVRHRNGWDRADYRCG